MMTVYFLNVIVGTWQPQLKALEQEMNCKLICNSTPIELGEIERVLRWAEQEQVDALVCTWQEYSEVMRHKPLVSVYPVSLGGFDTSVILYLLKKELREKHLEHLHRVVLGTPLPINVRLDILEEMFGLKLINPSWRDVLPQSYFDTLSRE